MKRSIRYFAFVATMAFCSLAKAADPAALQKDLDHMDWSFEQSQTGILESLRRSTGYAISMTTDVTFHFDLTIAILEHGKPIYSWIGSEDSLFQIVDHTLYYVDFNSKSSGGRFLAVDLKTGKQLWNSPLRALGPISHTKYFNAISFNIDLSTGVITIHGQESAGNYVECKDLKSGETIAHRTYPATKD